MSLRLVEIWRFKEPYHHTAIDDLESFFWLTIWCIHRTIEEKGELDPREADALGVLRSMNIRTHFNGRQIVLDRLLRARAPHPLLALFRSLLSQWWSLSQVGAEEISDLLGSTTAQESHILPTFLKAGSHTSPSKNDLTHSPCCLFTLLG